MKIIVVLCLALISFVLAASKKVIFSPKAPKAIGPYSQAIQLGDIVYLSGQIGLVGNTGKLISDSVVDQARQVSIKFNNVKSVYQSLVNIGYVLEAANSNYTNVVKCNVLLIDIADFAAVNEVYASCKFPFIILSDKISLQG
jgi:2-iminobutanoate/2-iminopropanoate deaminase